MSCFVKSTTPPNITPLDPNKHVNFTLGMVLGVDDLSQEFAYHDGHLHWQARDLLGYGTAAGLDVQKGYAESGGWQVSVSPGTALTAQGRLVVVDDTYCAYLEPWLHDHQNDPDALLPAGENHTIRLYLTLDYRTCLTDDLPVPGEPCRTEDAVTAPSRIKDNFCLQLSWQKPDQREENALRDFVSWLREIKVRAGGPAEGDSLQAFEEVVRRAVNPDQSFPDFMLGSPPVGLTIPEEGACDYLRAALRIWTTELRPKWLNAGAALGAGYQVDPPFPHPPSSGAILLAEVNFLVTDSPDVGEWVPNIRANGSDLVLDETARPILLHLRMLQEWMTCGRASTIVPGDTVKAECDFDLPDDPGQDEHYSRVDHTHGTPALPELKGDVTGAMNDNTLSYIQKTRVLASAPDVELEVGQALTLIQIDNEEGTSLAWMPSKPDGDVTGELTNNTLSAIQTTPVSAPPAGQALRAGQALALVNVTLDESSHLEWQPVNPGGDVTGELTNNKLAAIQTTPVNAPGPLSYEGDAGKALTLVQVPATAEAPNHLEWTPSGLSGDAVGALTATTVSAIQGTHVDVPLNTALNLRDDTGKVLTLVQRRGRPGGVHLEWAALKPDGDVSGGIASNRVDKLQNTPLNATGLDLNADKDKVLTLVQVAGAGGAPDHLEWKPVQPAAAGTPSVVQLGGDATGPSDGNTVKGLLGTAIKDPANPGDIGNALVYEGDNWIVEDKFVQHATDKPYRIVAAGIASVNFANNEFTQTSVSIDTSYNDLALMPNGVLGYGTFAVTFADFRDRLDKNEQLIVKALPQCTQPFVVFLEAIDPGKGIIFGLSSLDKGNLFGKIHIEISSYDKPAPVPPKGGKADPPARIVIPPVRRGNPPVIPG